MNKFVNIFLLLLVFPALFLSIFVGFDLKIEMLRIDAEDIPYLTEIYAGFAFIILFIGGKRALNRWTGVRMLSKIDSFGWNYEVNSIRKKQVTLYLLIEGLIHILIAFAFLFLTIKSLPIIFVMIILGFDHFIFCLFGNVKSIWRLGITNKAIVLGDREFKIIYFSGLRKVTVQQQTIFFEYIKDLQLSISLESIKEENRASFKAFLDDKLDRDKVFFSQDFKGF